MNILLDTHSFLWWISDSSRLPTVARNLMSESNNNLYWSAASSWEVAIKYELGRLPLPEKPASFSKPRRFDLKKEFDFCYCKMEHYCIIHNT
ncbi:MAG: type II toxin-antitoxin system VapC family toxin [Desulfobacteraceae bacterium]|nr:type II toxin-antitoxin system VapC family toxin [Desulfobacteraceae bacterium]